MILVLTVDQHPDIALVAGNALGFGLHDPRRPSDPPHARATVTWQPGSPVWSLELTSQRADDGALLWQGGFLPTPEEEDGALAGRAAREVARQLSRVVSAEALP